MSTQLANIFELFANAQQPLYGRHILPLFAMCFCIGSRRLIFIVTHFFDLLYDMTTLHDGVLIVSGFDKLRRLPNIPGKFFGSRGNCNSKKKAFLDPGPFSAVIQCFFDNKTSSTLQPVKNGKTKGLNA